MSRLCSVPNCGKPHRARTWCITHYGRWHKRGSPTVSVEKRELHGLHKSPEYRCWGGIRQRCENPKGSSYEHYGGRGIRMCERWRNSFMAFYEDMGPKPSPMHSIDRIDNDGDYTPENCRWADRYDQNRKRRITSRNRSGYEGVRRYGKRWVVELGLNYKTIYIGSFADIEDALSVRYAAATQLREGSPNGRFQTDR